MGGQDGKGEVRFREPAPIVLRSAGSAYTLSFEVEVAKP